MKVDFDPTAVKQLCFLHRSLAPACLQAWFCLTWPAMTIKFAPVKVPLSRRLQTAAVLQWVFSFLALGESSVCFI